MPISAPARPAPADPAIDQHLQNISIPPRPEILGRLQTEMSRDDPDLREITRLLGRDVAMTAVVLRMVNSPYYGLRRRADTLEAAVALIGLRQLMFIVMGFMARQVLKGDAPTLTRFLDTAAKRSWAMALMARELGGCEPDVAQCYGLFCDIGIPLLMQRFPDYVNTLKLANRDASQPFTEVEQARHQTDHALIGALMARTWGLSGDACEAIKVHHDYDIFCQRRTQPVVERLVAMGLVADQAIWLYAGMNEDTEWQKAKDHTTGALMLSGEDLQDLLDELVGGFTGGVA